MTVDDSSFLTQFTYLGLDVNTILISASVLFLYANLLIPACFPLNTGILLGFADKDWFSFTRFLPLILSIPKASSSISMCISLLILFSQIFYKIPEIHFQSSTTSTDDQRVTKNHVHNTNAPISSFPILVYSITFFLSSRLKTVMLALILLSYLLPTFISKFKRVYQIWPFIYL